LANVGLLLLCSPQVAVALLVEHQLRALNADWDLPKMQPSWWAKLLTQVHRLQRGPHPHW
jgi:hypothetical protein